MKTTVNLIIMKNVCIYQIILYIKVGATSSLCVSQTSCSVLQ